MGRELRGLRQAAGISGNQFAKDLGWPQSKISRIETGAQIPTESDVGIWCNALSLSKDERANLSSLLHQAEAEYHNWKDNYRLAGGAAGKQRQVLQFERSATVIREFQPSLIPGLLQTYAYASELLRTPFGPSYFGASESEISAMVETRLERQQILYNPSKQVRVVLLEGALMTRVCSAETLKEQLLRLIDLRGLRSLSLGVVPFTSQVPLLPLGGYTIYDTDVVILETLSGEQQLSAEEEVRQYIDSFDALSKVSLWGDKAISLVKTNANELDKTPE